MHQAVLDQRRHHLSHRSAVNGRTRVEMHARHQLATGGVERRAPLTQLLLDQQPQRHAGTRLHRAPVVQEAIDDRGQALDLFQRCYRFCPNRRSTGQVCDLFQAQ
jgi:hypothetical protein